LFLFTLDEVFRENNVPQKEVPIMKRFMSSLFLKKPVDCFDGG
jgi:hypothetical protein